MVSALELIHTTAEKIGQYGTFLTTTVGTTSTLICSALVNSSLPSSAFGNFGVLIEDGACAGQMGFVTPQGLDHTTGTLTLADTFTTAIASGVTFSLYDGNRLPPLRKLTGGPGLLQCANQAAERTWAEDTLSIAGVTSQIHYTVDTVTYPWFTDDTRIIDIQLPVTAADDVPTILPRSSWSWVSDGETRKLRFPGAPFRTGETFTIKVNRPGNSRLKLSANLRAILTGTAVSSVTVVAGGYYTALPTIAPSSGSATFTAVMTTTPGPITSVTVGAGGTYTAGFPPALTVTRTGSDTGWQDQATQTAGLVTLSDELIPDVRFMTAAMLALAYEELAAMEAPGATVAEWLAKAEQWLRRSNSLKVNRLPTEPNQGVVRLRPVTVRSFSRRY